MFASNLASARKIPPSHSEWVPLRYMERAVDFLLDRGSAALVLDPGLRKTSITLEAFTILQEEGIAQKMLVVAPLRVCQLVWRQEAAKWTQFKHLKIVLLHGPDKEKLLAKDADIYLINPEGVPWLASQFWKKPFPFDTVVLDELTKFKNAQAVRHKALMPLLSKVQRRWGLTGTLLPNGYLDLFGQMKILDDGAALGFYFSHYRNKYFEKDFTGFNYTLRRGATKAIEAAIKPYVLRMSADDYLQLPPLVEDIRSVTMPPAARAKYDEMKKELVAELEGNLVEAGNAAAAYSKLKQMANGAVYAGDGVFQPRKVVHLHDAKIEALVELVEELDGEPLFIGYEFNHDLHRLREALGNPPYIGSGVSGAQAEMIERKWNAGKLPVLLAHPASAGHGLNFQLGNACHVAWFSCTWDYELYDQFIRRIFRSGNTSLRIFNHVFLVENTIDNKTRDAILDKGLAQSKFYDALNAEIYHEGKSAASPNEASNREDDDMVRKLSRKPRKAPKAVEPDDVEDDEEDETEEEEAPTRRSRRKTSSSAGTKRKLRKKTPEPEEAEDDEAEDDEEEEEEEEAPKPTRRRRKAKPAPEPEEDEDEDDDEEEAPKPKRRAGRKVTRKTAKAEAAEAAEDDEDEDEAPVKTRARKKFFKATQKRLDEDDEDDDEDDDEEAVQGPTMTVEALAKAIVDELIDRLTA